MRALITGIAGFCGSHLAEHLLAQGYEVAGIEINPSPTPYPRRGLLAPRSEGAGEGVEPVSRQATTASLRPPSPRRGGVESPPPTEAAAGIDLRLADLRDRAQVQRIVAEVQPDQIYHLAALIQPQGADGFQALYEANVYGTINLLDAAAALPTPCAVLITGSSAQYGMVPLEKNPILETQPFRPVTHYAVSKATQDLLGVMYAAQGKLHVVRTRTFNIVGPRQSSRFVSGAFARQVAEIEQGRRSPLIEVGNLEPRRDFVDVRDVVRAYRLALERGQAGAAYNVCSGQGRSVRSLLDGLLALSTARDIVVRQDPARLQAADVPLQIGSYERLRADTGWQPEIAWEQTLQDLLDYWREAVASEQ